MGSSHFPEGRAPGRPSLRRPPSPRDLETESGRGLTELALRPVEPRVTAAGVVVDGLHAFTVAAARPGPARR